MLNLYKKSYILEYNYSTRGGVDIHDLKGNKNSDERDLYKDAQGNIYVKPKGGRRPGEETGYNINDF